MTYYDVHNSIVYSERYKTFFDTDIDVDVDKYILFLF